MSVCPLVFLPIFRPKIWGGRRLEDLMEKKLPTGEVIGESWELSDLPGAESVVARGTEAG
jgi:mannose-6-phosphate isomerase